MRKSRVALVTGAGRGIGKACAQALLREGWTTVFVGRDPVALEQAIEESQAPAGGGVALGCDVRDVQDVERVFATVEERFGRLDLLFNNAGIMGPAGSIDEIPLAGWHETLAVNLEGAFLCARSAFALMRSQEPQGGRIINNGSIAAQAPRPGTVPYSVSKHAITGLTRCLALDGRPYGITCGQIDIGNVLTDMSQSFTKGMLQPDGARRPEPVFELRHVVEAVVYMAGLPASANVLFMTVMASGMPFVGRG